MNMDEYIDQCHMAFGFQMYRYTRRWFPRDLCSHNYRPGPRCPGETGPSGAGVLPGRTAKVERRPHQFQRISPPGSICPECASESVSRGRGSSTICKYVMKQVTFPCPVRPSWSFTAQISANLALLQKESLYNTAEVANITQNLTTQIYRLKGNQFLAKVVHIFVKKYRTGCKTTVRKTPSNV